jgi:hypothetical protein
VVIVDTSCTNSFSPSQLMMHQIIGLTQSLGIFLRGVGVDCARAWSWTEPQNETEKNISEVGEFVCPLTHKQKYLGRIRTRDTHVRSAFYSVRCGRGKKGSATCFVLILSHLFPPSLPFAHIYKKKKKKKKSENFMACRP